MMISFFYQFQCKAVITPWYTLYNAHVYVCVRALTGKIPLLSARSVPIRVRIYRIHTTVMRRGGGKEFLLYEYTHTRGHIFIRVRYVISYNLLLRFWEIYSRGFSPSPFLLLLLFRIATESGFLRLISFYIEDTHNMHMQAYRTRVGTGYHARLSAGVQSFIRAPHGIDGSRHRRTIGGLIGV